MSKQTEAMNLALEQTLEMLIDNREYIEANERSEYLAMYDKAIAGAEKALVEQPAQQEQKAQQTFAERCQLAQQLLPDAQYRAMLTALHTEMLAALAEQPAQPLIELLNDPEVHYPGNFDTPERAVALLTGLCQDAATEIERLEREASIAGHTIQQLVTALEGSGTRMRSDQWYIEIEAVAAGKHYLNTVALQEASKPDNKT